MDSMHHKPRTIEPARLSAASASMWALEQSPSERLFLCQGQLLLPNSALSGRNARTRCCNAHHPQRSQHGRNFTATTVVDHSYDLELPPAFMLVQNEAFVTTSPTNPSFDYGLNDTIHLFKVETDTKSLIKTENSQSQRLYYADHDRQSRKSNRSLYRRLRRRPNPLID